MNKQDLQERIKTEGISFAQFNDETDSFISAANESDMNNIQKQRFGFTKLNQRRTARILKTYKVDEKLSHLIQVIDTPQTWLVITEPWCGDSAQTLPNIFRMSELNNNIELKILYRDQNLDVIDQYLTDGNRAILKLIVFNLNGEELSQWGPRPNAAKKLVTQWKSEGDTKDQFMEKLHLWYGRNRGKELEKEFHSLIESIPLQQAPPQELLESQ